MKRTLILCVALWGGLLLSASAATTGGQWTVRGNVDPREFIIQSHRGAGELAPENTIEAFELGWKLGTIPEADIRTTKDGIIVAFHDANLKRMVKGASPELQKKGVVDVSYDELSRLDVGSWKGEQFTGRRVSKISEVFEVMRDKPGRRLYMDIKNVELPQLAREVRHAAVNGQVILASPDHNVIREWKSLVPESQTLLWMGGDESALKSRLEALKQAKFVGITQAQVHVRLNTNNASAEPFNVSREFLRKTGALLREHGILFQSLPWGVAKPEVYWQLMDLGVASFATDHPEVTVQAVRDYYRRKD